MEAAEPAAPARNTSHPPGMVKPLPIEGPAYQISQEHCYSKLGPFRSSPSAAFFPTEVLFLSLVRDTDAVSNGSDECERTKEQGDGGENGDDLQGSASNMEGVMEEREGEGEREEGEEYIDVVGVNPPTSLPYDESRVGLIMMECVKHLNLVKVPPENSDLLMEKVLLECGFQQRRLLSTLLRILQGDHLARLTCQQVGRQFIDPHPLPLFHMPLYSQSYLVCSSLNRLLMSQLNAVYTTTEPSGNSERLSVMSIGCVYTNINVYDCVYYVTVKSDCVFREQHVRF